MLIAHLSDMHLRAPGDLAHGVADTATSLAAAVERLQAMRPAPDAVIATGDLVDDPSAEAYAQLKRALAPLAMAVYLIPGNRDERTLLRRAFSSAGYFPEDGMFLHYVVDDFPVRLVALDTVTAGSKFGALCGARLDWLDARLAEAPDRPTLVFMHHPPFKAGVPFMDEQPFTGAEALAAVIRRHPQVERIACGHLHRPIQACFAGTLACVAPATAFHMPLALDLEAPMGLVMEPAAGLLHLWTAEAGMVTHALPLAPHPGPFPFRRRPAPSAAG